MLTTHTYLFVYCTLLITFFFLTSSFRRLSLLGLVIVVLIFETLDFLTLGDFFDDLGALPRVDLPLFFFNDFFDLTELLLLRVDFGGIFDLFELFLTLDFLDFEQLGQQQLKQQHQQQQQLPQQQKETKASKRKMIIAAMTISQGVKSPKRR